MLAQEKAAAFDMAQILGLHLPSWAAGSHDLERP